MAEKEDCTSGSVRSHVMMESDRIVHLMDNAYTALSAAQTDWAKNYWQTVINALSRKFGRMH